MHIYIHTVANTRVSTKLVRVVVVANSAQLRIACEPSFDMC